MGNRIENFCASQTPVAYLSLLRLVGWLGSLHPGVKLDRPPLSGDVMRIGSLGPKFTTTAPLVNLAWGEFDFLFLHFPFFLSRKGAGSSSRLQKTKSDGETFKILTNEIVETL